MDEMTFTLNSPLTEEEWDLISDVDFDNTDEITFHTKHGKEVTFVKRKTGRWINSSNMEKAVICSECGEEAWYKSYCGYVTKSKFCPNCGAKMEI